MFLIEQRIYIALRMFWEYYNQHSISTSPLLKAGGPAGFASLVPCCVIRKTRWGDSHCRKKPYSLT
jgi:hypothetical protein